MPRNPLSYRQQALALGALIYTVLRSGALFQVLEDGLRSAFPDLAHGSELGLKVLRALLEAGSLIAIILVLERMLLLWKTREIRGEWVYHSSSGTWGHVRIRLEGTRLRYAVDLYGSKSDAARAALEGVPLTTVGHGMDRLVACSDGMYYIWYHVPATRHGKAVYPERHGLLTLRPTLNEDTYSATWERTGSLPSCEPAQSSGPPAITDHVARSDQEHAAGSFYFFMRKAAFQKHFDMIPDDDDGYESSSSAN
jgi:hypothetical protein